jgi:hypothetical protein
MVMGRRTLVLSFRANARLPRCLRDTPDYHVEGSDIDRNMLSCHKRFHIIVGPEKHVWR